MFAELVTSSPFCGGVADRCFSNITGDKYRSDVSFLSTLRALLAPRLSENESINLRVTQSSLSEGQISSKSDDDIAHLMWGEIRVPHNTLAVHLCAHPSAEANERCVNAISNYFAKDSDWKRVDKVTAMFKQRKFLVTAFISPTIKSTVVFVEGGNQLRRYHMLQSSISVFLPWFFESKVLTEEEFKLESILFDSKTVDEYNEYIEVMSQKYDFKGMRIRQELAGFETKAERRRKTAVEREIDNLEQSIRAHNDSIRKLIKDRSEQCLILLGINAKLAQCGEDSEIMNYFLHNPRLILEHVEDATISFIVKDYALFFDEGSAQAFIDNQNGYIYDYQGTQISASDMIMLMKSIFIEQTLKLRFCAAYSLTIGSGVSAGTHRSFGGECSNYMPNPHVNEFGCMGTYVPIINERILDGDYIGAIEQCMASCRSINFNDGAVMEEFIQSLYDEDTPRCIELPNGELATPSEAIAFLKGECG